MIFPIPSFQLSARSVIAIMIAVFALLTASLNIYLIHKNGSLKIELALSKEESSRYQKALTDLANAAEAKLKEAEAAKAAAIAKRQGYERAAAEILLSPPLSSDECKAAEILIKHYANGAYKK